MQNEAKLNISLKGNLKIIDEATGIIERDVDNAIHPQNMARIIARALANEPNSHIFRLALGNGGTFIDAASNIVFRPPNDGSQGAGWESRLYNETYSEIVDSLDPGFATDPGSAGPDNIRIGGGADPSADPPGGGVISEEVARKSNIIITMFLNENEPSGQLSSQAPGPSLTDEESTFLFDEIGLYSPGLPAVDTSGSSSVDVGNKISTDNSTITAGVYSLEVEIDGVAYQSDITVPASGTGPSGTISFGDICEGINSGAWISGGDPINDFAFFFITDRSGGSYPSIIGQESFGFFTVQSLSAGTSSTVDLSATGLLLALAQSIPANVNVNQTAGQNAGVINSVTPILERERLLTHVIFTPFLKSAESIKKIVYTITVSVQSTTDSDTTVNSS